MTISGNTSRFIWIWFVFVLLWLVSIPARVHGAAPDEKSIFMGAVSCRPCHLSPKSGAQFKVWQAGPHARAYRTLASQQAAALAKRLGIAEPQSSPRCLKCHVTAFGVESKRKSPKLTVEEGVSCEACHGPGSRYRRRKVMREIASGKLVAIEFGLVPQSEKVCVRCHNKESPTFKGFNYREMVAKILHPIPR